MPSFSPYDWNESIQQRNEYIEDRLREGSPVIAVAYEDGILMLTLRHNQRKLYEIYDKLMFGAVGNHSDIEQIRIGAIDVAHTEGFSRSADDVSLQRLASFRLSPAIKKIYSDPFAQPVVLKGIFAELGKTADKDILLVLSYDGEFTITPGYAVIGGSFGSEDKMSDHLKSATADGAPSLGTAVNLALKAWAIGKQHAESLNRPNDDEDDTPPTPEEFLAETLKTGLVIEATVLERNVTRESRYRVLRADEVKEFTTV